MNSKRKGNGGEREVARILRAHGFEDARRGLQYQSGQVEADVEGMPLVHLEVKRVEALNIHKAMEQSRRDAKPGEMPWVLHRKNHEEWLATMRMEDALMLYKAWIDERGKHGKQILENGDA